MSKLERTRGSVCRSGAVALSAVLVAAAGSGGCWWWDDDVAAGSADYAYEYYYPYTYYYPANLSYSSMYWSDDYLYSDWYYAQSGSSETSRLGVGSFLRALARGEAVCPGQVTITPRMAPPPCLSPDTTSVRSGATIVFSGCQTAGGGRIDGTIDVQANRSASEQTCSSNTRITMSHTTTITDLTFTGPGGGRLVIPTQTDTGTNTYNYGELPAMVGVTSMGRLQVYAANGSLTADHSHNGTRNITYQASNKTYTVSGMINTQDARAGASASLVGSNITRTTDCCHPTSGRLVVTRTGGTNPGEHTWMFGATCGQMSLDGAEVTPPACL